MEPLNEQADQAAETPPVAAKEAEFDGAVEAQAGLGITEFVVAPPAVVEPVYHSWVDGWAPEQPPDWIDIMLRPRRTIRRIIDENPGKHAYLIAALFGITGEAVTFGDGVTLASGAQYGWHLAVVMGALGGLVYLYFGGGLLRLAAWILGGEASFKETRTLFAWSSIPILFGNILYRLIDAASLLLMGGVYAVTPPHPVLDPIAFGVEILAFALGIWSFVILVMCVAEVHRLGVLRAVMAVFLSVLIPLAVFGTLMLGFTLPGLR